MKEKTIAIIGLFFTIGLIIVIGTAIVSQIFKGAF
jgi:hypothetical protein